MMLVDTSIWIDHFRQTDSLLSSLLINSQVLVHPFIIGELALGNLQKRNTILEHLDDLPHAISASDSEVLHFIEKHKLAGSGIGYIDAHLLASATLNAVPLWTRDKRLHQVVLTLGLAPAYQ